MKSLRLLFMFHLLAFGVLAARAADQELNLYAWSEYIPQAVLDGFTKETGIKVNYETFASGEEMLAKLLAGGTRYDLIQPPDYIAEALIKNQLLVPLDYKKLPNFKNLLPEFTQMPHDPEQRFTIPYMAGTVGIVVNTDKIKEPVKGYQDLFSGNYKNRIVVLDDGRELVVAALYTQGIGLNDITPANLEKVKPILAGWFRQIKLFDSDSPKTALLNGDVDIGLVWGGEAAILWNENQKFHYLLPAEGAHLFVDILAIPKRAKNVEAAHRFIDYLLRPEVSVLISEEFPYTNPNREARKLLTPAQLANPGSYPQSDRTLDTFRHLGESGALIDELVTDLKNAK
jgi:spermidine/putrescine-binding protein